MNKSILVMLLITFTGCSSFGPAAVKQKNDLDKLKDQQIESARTFATGTVDALDAYPEVDKHPETALAHTTAKDTQSILGLPQPSKRLNVPGILSDDSDAKGMLEGQRVTYVSNSEKIKVLEVKLQESNLALIEMGKIYEKEHNQSIVSRIWHWLWATLGIGGMIALAVCFPAILPILGSLLSWVISMVPSLFSFLGLVGKSVATNVVKGISSVHDQLSKAPPDKTYTAAEVQTMLDDSLAKATDQSDRDMIKFIKTKYNVK